MQRKALSRAGPAMKIWIQKVKALKIQELRCQDSLYSFWVQWFRIRQRETYNDTEPRLSTCPG